MEESEYHAASANDRNRACFSSKRMNFIQSRIVTLTAIQPALAKAEGVGLGVDPFSLASYVALYVVGLALITGIFAVAKQGRVVVGVALLIYLLGPPTYVIAEKKLLDTRAEKESEKRKEDELRTRSETQRRFRDLCRGQHSHAVPACAQIRESQENSTN